MLSAKVGSIGDNRLGGWYSYRASKAALNMLVKTAAIELRRSNDIDATLTQPGQPSHDIVLPRRTLRECLAEELRRLDPDVLYGRVITEGWALIGPPEQSGAASSAASKS